MPLIYISFLNKMRRGLSLSSFLLVLFLISNKTYAQQFAPDKNLLRENLLNLYNGTDSAISIDDFFKSNGLILNCNKTTEVFFGVESTSYSQIRNSKINNYLFADTLERYFKNILPVDFDESILKKGQSKYDIIYLLLKRIIGDTASVRNFITARVNQQSDIKTIVFVNRLFNEYFKNIFPSILTEKEHFFKINYKDFYSKEWYDEILSIGKWDKGEAAVYGEEIFMILYESEYLKINSENDFIKSFNKTGNLFKKAMCLDIALSKEISLDSVIEKIIQSPLENNFKIFAIDQTLKHTQEVSVKDICTKALKDFCNNITYPVIAPKTIFEFNKASNFFTYSALVVYCCETRSAFSDSCLQQLQLQSQYNWDLFTEVINNRARGYGDFVKRHIKTLGIIPFDFFKKKKNIKNEYPVFVYPTPREYYAFLPQNFLRESRFNPATDGVDSLFEKLFTTSEYLGYIKNNFNDESFLKNQAGRFNKVTMAHFFNDSSINFLERGYAFYYMITERPKLILETMEKVSAIETRAGLFKMAALINKTDRANYLSKEFSRTLKIINTKINKGDIGEELFYIANALEYFKGKETKIFYKAVMHFLSDTTNSFKMTSILLGQYPVFFYDNKLINNFKRKLYLDELSKSNEITNWKNIIPILNPADKMFVRDLFYRSKN